MRHTTKLAMTVFGTAALACGARQHITDTHGKSFEAAYSRQPVQLAKKAPPSGPMTGLDSQEAAIISEGYRKSLVPKSMRQQAKDEPIIMIAPPTQSRYGTVPLAPSVPKE